MFSVFYSLLFMILSYLPAGFPFLILVPRVRILDPPFYEPFRSDLSLVFSPDSEPAFWRCSNHFRWFTLQIFFLDSLPTSLSVYFKLANSVTQSAACAAFEFFSFTLDLNVLTYLSSQPSNCDVLFGSAFSRSLFRSLQYCRLPDPALYFILLDL